MKILLTGATSFTGYWFAQELKAQGHEVICTLTAADATAYSEGRKAARFKKLKKDFELIYNIQFGTETFLQLLDQGFDVLALHGAWMPNYKSDTFDVEECLHRNLFAVEEVFAALGKKQTACITTGTYFEPGEGSLEHAATPSVSPYGTAKALIAYKYIELAAKFEIPMAKFVIPNPFGPLEDEKFTAHVMMSWLKGETVEVRTPKYIRDHVYVGALAKTYSGIVQTLREQKPGAPLILRPSQYRESIGEFTARMAQEVKARLSIPCDYVLLEQTQFSEPLSRLNPDPVGESSVEDWDKWIEYYQQKVRH